MSAKSEFDPEARRSLWEQWQQNTALRSFIVQLLKDEKAAENNLSGVTKETLDRKQGVIEGLDKAIGVLERKDNKSI